MQEANGLTVTWLNGLCLSHNNELPYLRRLIRAMLLLVSNLPVKFHTG